MEALGIDHIDLTVSDLDRSTAFYEKVLGVFGFRPVPNAHGVVFESRFKTVGLYLAAPQERSIAFHRYRVGPPLIRDRSPPRLVSAVRESL